VVQVVDTVMLAVVVQEDYLLLLLVYRPVLRIPLLLGQEVEEARELLLLELTAQLHQFLQLQQALEVAAAAL
jgi:hypothetical protein